MKIAIPIWEDRISPVLDSASRLLIVEMENRKETSRYELFLDEHDLTRKCHHIQTVGVDVLICSAVSRPFLRMLEVAGIEMIPEISGTAEEVLKAYCRGDVVYQRFSMPGCRRKHLRERNPTSSSAKPCGRREKGEGRRPPRSGRGKPPD